jgi:hypothetical protein
LDWICDPNKGGLQWGPCGNDGYTVKQYKEKKFDKAAKDFIKERYGLTKTKNIWVCWGIHPRAKEQTAKEAKKLDIEIWELKDKIEELVNAVGSGYYEDDIMQALSLIKAASKNLI